MNEPYYQPAHPTMRGVQSGVSGVLKPKGLTSKAGKAYVITQTGTLYHHFYKIAWKLEDEASLLQYIEGYLFEEVFA